MSYDSQWIPHNGLEIPCDERCTVQIRTVEGIEYSGMAMHMNWAGNSAHKIIGYKIIQHPPALTEPVVAKPATESPLINDAIASIDKLADFSDDTSLREACDIVIARLRQLESLARIKRDDMFGVVHRDTGLCNHLIERGTFLMEQRLDKSNYINVIERAESLSNCLQIVKLVPVGDLAEFKEKVKDIE